MLKSDVIWPAGLRYKSHSEWEPIGFFSECLCNATSFDLMLGFFSSSAINVLSDGFATFLYNGGRMRLVINDILSTEDQSCIAVASEPGTLPFIDLSDLESLNYTLSKRDKHFFECLSWLIRNERIDIKIVAPKGGVGIAHSKYGLFSDGINTVSFEGSVNFSYAALVQNMESMTIACDWNGKADEARVNDTKDSFNKIFQGNDDSLEYLSANDVKARMVSNFKSKEISELLEDEAKLLAEKDLSNLPATIHHAINKAKERVRAAIEKKNKQQAVASTEPHFPFTSGPREYQIEAFEKWKNNNPQQRGLFAMATGTGKTLTSLNCLLQIYVKSHFYKAIILVPTITLVNQWEDECRKFGFTNIIKVCSKNINWKNEVDAIKLNEQLNELHSFIIISTYASFGRDIVFQQLTSFSPKTTKRLLLIADEAHNIGSKRIMNKISGVKFLRRIGLSATPDRQFDDTGNFAIRTFFGCKPDSYTFEFTMREAIDKGYLCRYNYFPHVVRLTGSEMKEYMKISLQLAKLYNFDSESFPGSNDILMALLLKRKRIIHKAQNKESIFRAILEERFQQKGNLKYTLVYVPEGDISDENEPDVIENDNENISEDILAPDHLIDRYTKIVADIHPSVTVKNFISGLNNRDRVLADFASGDLEVLTSMKCLDEGVDVPRSELAIFCSSTGNPRQFIQRRGRILRKHPDKFKAIIHDLVVVPEVTTASESYNMERNLLKGELKRVRDFATLSENADYAYEKLETILSYYNLPLF